MNSKASKKQDDPPQPYSPLSESFLPPATTRHSTFTETRLFVVRSLVHPFFSTSFQPSSIRCSIVRPSSRAPCLRFLSLIRERALNSESRTIQGTSSLECESRITNSRKNSRRVVRQTEKLQRSRGAERRAGG